MATSREARAGAWRPRWFWPSFAVPGMVWLVALFLLPFYVVLSIAFGAVDPLFRTPVPVWNPVEWNPFQFELLYDRIFGPGAFLGPAFLRTFLYVAAASTLCLVVAYPVAYYVTRYAGRRKGLLLVALLAPFWISYMMRMLAWVNLLESDGMINNLLVSVGLLADPFPWLAGQPVTVTLGLVYGYIPYMVLALFAGLNGIDQRLLEALVYGYLAWSILPVAIAVWFSFNAGRSRSSWQGFSLRWYWQDPLLSVWNDPDLQRALLHSLRLAMLTTLVAVPLGVAFAIGLDRWRGRLAAGFNFQMLLSFVLPEIILAVALLFLFTNLLKAVQLGTWAQLLGLVTFQLSYPVIICRARLLSIGNEYEEAAMDLGASPLKALRHVLLPLLSPAIFASAVLVFADVMDDFVLVRYLSADAASEPMSVKIYNSARGSPTPALNALATIMLLSSLFAIALGFLVYRRLTRGERTQESTVEGFAAQI